MAESHFDRRQREWHSYVTARWAAVRGLPAVTILVASMAVLTLAQLRQRQGEIRGRYLDAVQNAARDEDWSLVETLGRKLAHLRPADPIAQYYIALSAAGNGQSDRAVRLMKQIAPRDRQGFGPAQWWLIRNLATQRPQLTAAELREFRDRLHQFLELQHDHPEAHVLLAQAEAALGDLDAAVRQMSIAARVEPNLHLTAARFASRLGQNSDARTQAEQASRHYEWYVDEHPEDVDVRLNFSDTLTMLGEPDRAARVLIAGFELTQDPRLQVGFVELCCKTFDIHQLADGPSDSSSQRQLSLLQLSLRCAPHSKPLLKRLAQLTVQQTPAAAEAKDLLDPYLKNGSAPAVVHLVLGTDALERGQYDIARTHFGRAHEMDSAFPACLNNFAWSLAHGEHPDLDRALSLANEATSQDPDRPEFPRDTRSNPGQVGTI